MSAICSCRIPALVENDDGFPYCKTCGHWWDTDHGSYGVNETDEEYDARCKKNGWTSPSDVEAFKEKVPYAKRKAAAALKKAEARRTARYRAKILAEYRRLRGEYLSLMVACRDLVEYKSTVNGKVITEEDFIKLRTTTRIGVRKDIEDFKSNNRPSVSTGSPTL